MLVENLYKQIAIRLHLTIRNIRSAIWWAITKVILNYLLLPTRDVYKRTDRGFYKSQASLHKLDLGYI